ncbi:MAG: DUF2726 domain-containing protein [Mariprofundales bacterium]
MDGILWLIIIFGLVYFFYHKKSTHVNAKPKYRHWTKWSIDEQLRYIERCDYKIRRVCDSNLEMLVLEELRKILKSYNSQQYQQKNFSISSKLEVLAQIRIGNIFSTNDKQGYEIIQAKRVDFCIVNKAMIPIVIIEVNGDGHYTDNDSLKKQLCNATGMQYIALELAGIKGDEQQKIIISEQLKIKLTLNN